MSTSELEAQVTRFGQNESRVDKWVNGTDSENYSTSSGVDVPTIQKFYKTMAQNGLLAAVPFDTKALMQASDITTVPNDGYAVVTNDPTLSNNGFYKRTATTTWTYIKWNTESILKEWANANGKFKTVGLSNTSAPNANTLIKAGEYILTGAAPEGLNYPFGGALVLAVENVEGSSFILQKCMDSTGQFKSRRSLDAGSTWSPWVNVGQNLIDSLIAGNPSVKSQLLTPTTDLNSIFKEGFYCKAGSGDIQDNTNYPVKLAGLMYVCSASIFGNGVSQLYHVASNNTMYIRTYTGTSWRPWTAVATTDTVSTLIANTLILKATIKSQALTNLINLNDVKSEGEYFKMGSGDITSDLNYPVQLAGYLSVKGHDGVNNANLVQTYNVVSTNNVYTRTYTGVSWTAWTKLNNETDVNNLIRTALDANVRRLEWNMTGNNLNPVYDHTNKTLSWSAALVAGYKGVTGNRIFLSAGSIVCDTASKPYGVLYLDLNSIPLDGVITNENIASCIKWEQYPTFRGEAHMYPLAKIDKSKNSGNALIACNGFPLIKNSFESGVKFTSPVLTWQKVAGSTKVSFNPETKEFKITGYILAPYDNGPGRIRINDVTVNIVENFDVVYIDLTALGTATEITSSNASQVLKVGRYGTTFKAKQDQIALASYNSSDNVLYPAPGFLKIEHPIAVNPDESESSSATLLYTKSETLMDIYLDNSAGTKFRIGLQHQTYPMEPQSWYASNADLWRIWRMFECDPETLAAVTEVVNSGEWECALLHEERTQPEGIEADHVGGYHGDEHLTDCKFYVDSVVKQADFVTSKVLKAKTIEMVQRSVIYFQGTLRPMCDHIKFYKFTPEGVEITQEWDWKYETVNLTRAWVTMLPILRDPNGLQVTDHSSRNEDYYTQVDDNTLEGFTRRYTLVKDGSAIKIWGDSSGYSAQVDLIETVKFSDKEDMWVTNGGGYNKLYVSAIGTNESLVTVPIGTKWKNKSKYSFDKIAS